MAAEQIGGCVGRAKQFGPFLSATRKDLREVRDRLHSDREDLWVRLLSVAHLAHNLRFAFLLYLDTDPPSVEKEYSPVFKFVVEMLPKHPELGRIATENFVELMQCIETNGYQSLRRGWGRWVIINVIRDVTGVYLSPYATLNPDQEKFAEAIDDYIVAPFLIQSSSLYEKFCPR